VARVLDFDCELVFDTSRQDGTPQKLLDVSRIQALGWKAKVGLEEGIRRTFASAQSQLEIAVH
jgi:GDP-L-fucose synthase